jgi:hypothetical protein
LVFSFPFPLACTCFLLVACFLLLSFPMMT